MNKLLSKLKNYWSQQKYQNLILKTRDCWNKFIVKKYEVLESKFKNYWNKFVAPILKDPLFLSWWVYSYAQEDNNQISTRVGSAGYRWTGHDYRGDLFMFVEDMYQGIMPFTHVGQNNEFTANFEPEIVNAQIRRMVIESISPHEYTFRLEDSIADLVREVTHSIFTYGRSIYEIVAEKDQNDVLTSFHLVSIFPLSVRKIFGFYFQIISWRVAKDSHVKAGIKYIPKEKIMYFEMPKELGGKSMLIKILKRLSILGKEIIPEFQMEAMKNNKNIGFDMNQYIKTKYLEKALLTKQFGWRQRKIPDKNILEYYSIYRTINLSYSQAIIRENILGIINDALSGSYLNINARIQLRGIPTAEEIKGEFLNLKNGDLSFEDLFRRISLNL